MRLLFARRFWMIVALSALILVGYGKPAFAATSIGRGETSFLLLGFSLQSPEEGASKQVAAQDPPKPLPEKTVEEDTSKEPTRQEIDKKVQSIQGSQQFDEPTKAELLKRYKATLDWIAISEEAQKKAAQYQAEIDGVAEAVAKVKAELTTSTPVPLTEFSKETTLQEIEQKLSQAELQLREANTLLTRREEELKRRSERKSELTKQIDDTQQRFEAAKEQLATSSGIEESPELTAARRVELAAHRTALRHQLKRYQVEVQRHDALVELLPLQRDLAQREKNLREKQVASLQQAVAEKRKTESKIQADETQQDLTNLDPALQHLAERNADLAKEYQKLSDSIIQKTDQLTKTQKTLRQLEEDFQSTQEKVRYAGESVSIGLELRKKRSELPDTNKCEQQIREVLQVMPKAYLDRFDFHEERAELSDLDMAINAAVAKLDHGFVSAIGKEQVEQRVRDLLERKRDLLDKLIDDYDQYLSKLSYLEVDNRKLIEKCEAFENYVSERVLWVRSAEMLCLKSLKDVGTGLMHLARPKPWIELSKQCGLDAFRQPIVIIFMVIAFGVLIAARSRLRGRIKNLCVAASGSSTLRIWPTLEGIFWTAAVTAALPLFFAFAGWWIAYADDSSDLGRSIGWGLRSVAVMVWVLKFTRRLCLPGLVAESHFGWSSYSLATVRRHLHWLMYAGLPLVFSMIFFYHYHDGTLDNSLGRITFIGVMLLLAAFMHAVFFSKNHVLRETMARRPDWWPVRFWLVFYLFFIGLPLALAVLAWIGYYYSAQQLATRLDGTMALVFGLVLIHAVVSRWFLVKRRNLSIAQMKARQAREAEKENAPSVPAVVPVVEEQRDLSVIHQQLNYLLGHAVVVSFLVGSWLIWADVLPALNVLDNRTIWSSTIETVEMHEDADGNAIPQKVPVEVRTTARHALIATLILFASFVIGRHLPALLEITLLSRMHFDRGGRHAISILLRYLVGLIGVIMACRTMSITWSSIQWLAAGITVGLGFGLQEIFANFISGLILLFERPIRVGDIITLDDITGTVTDIRIRTTTVTNWDRKELIVPNKELITGRLLNWTLSDPVNRIVVNVGVAYKTDTRKVRELVLAIATEHPNVLDHPEPLVTFEAFGDSALQFVLRCYIGSMETRLATIHELHETINDRFSEADIEIAFPQMDLHLRSTERMQVSLHGPDDTTLKKDSGIPKP